MSRSTTAGMAEGVEAMMARYREPVLAGMRAALDRPGFEHVRLMRRHLGWEDAAGEASHSRAGKMLRPAMCLLAAEASGGSIDGALPAAVSIELLHNFTLIHDDIEDRSETRHGRATLWADAGVALAINAGDGMFVLARAELLKLAECGAPAEAVLRAARMLDDACLRLCEGQHLDLTFEARTTVTVAEYERMVGGKTAALAGAAMGIGAVAAGADDEMAAAWTRCGELLGVAFQIRDDTLGIWGSPEVTGKPASDDIRARKKSFPVAYAFESLDATARDRLVSLYAGPMNKRDVATVRELLERAGSRQAADEAARWHAGEALTAISSLPVDSDRRGDIEAFAAYFVERDA